MSLTRKFLAALGIDADKVDEIITAHSETVEALKKERDKAQEKADANADAAKQLENTKKELEEVRGKLEDAELYKEKYDKVKGEFDTYKNEIEGQQAKNAKTEAYKKLLRDSNIAEKYIDKITKLADIDKLELDKDGNIKDADDVKKTVETDWADFVGTTGKRGADVKTPPTNGGKDDKPDTTYAADRVAKYMADRYGDIKKD